VFPAFFFPDVAEPDEPPVAPAAAVPAAEVADAITLEQEEAAPEAFTIVAFPPKSQANA